MENYMIDILKHASDMYYQGTPIMSDAEFDVLAAHFNYNTVGHRITDGIPHYYPMYSLRKCFNLADAPLNLKECVVTPKLDGAAISILYVGGEVSLALTRGDGKHGRDITEKVKLLVPNDLGPNFGSIVQITGEVVAPKSIPNARNYAAGALNLKSMDEFQTRDLSFVAYGLEGVEYGTYTYNMEALEELGFHTVMSFDTAKYPTDGTVFRIDCSYTFQELGYTDHHPRGAFALKEQKAGVVTRLNDVIWQVGKSGVISPVAILEPVKVGDATVSRATLHNMEYIDALNLEIGCNVEIIRSGEIIPRVVRRVD